MRSGSRFMLFSQEFAIMSSEMEADVDAKRGVFNLSGGDLDPIELLMLVLGVIVITFLFLDFLTNGANLTTEIINSVV